jgi:hypothetical protein
VCVVLRPLPDPVPPAVRLRLLKAALRTYRFRCLALR